MDNQSRTLRQSAASSTVAAHLEQGGVQRRMNARRFTNDDVNEAVRRYRDGETLATVGIAFNVDAATEL
jgi:hypothetical protein